VPGGLPPTAWRVGGGVPEGAAVVLERCETFAGDAETTAGVADGDRRPVREIALGGGPVPGEVPQRQLGERLVAIQPAGVRHPLGVRRVRVLVTERTAAADDPVQLEVGEEDHQRLPVGLDPPFAKTLGDLDPRAIRLVLEDLDDRRGGAVQRAVVEPMWPEQL